MANPILIMKAVGKRFPGVVALRGVSLDVARGEGRVLLGENGAGKSTLINLLAGVYPADEGEIVFDGAPYSPSAPTDAYRAGIRVVHQELAMLTQMTVAENLMFERLPQRWGVVNYRATNQRAAELLEEVGLDVAPTTLVSRLGVAQMQLVEIAKTLAHESKLLILDEPTATLTAKEVDRLFDILRRLKARGVTILYISHRLQEIAEIGDRVTVLRDGQLVATRPLAGLAIPDIVRMMVGRSIHDGHAFRDAVKASGEALRVEGLRRNAKSPEVSFSVARGEIVGLAGLVGSGRTETVRAIFGADPKVSGEIFVEGERVTIKTPRDAVKRGLCLMTEDRKAQGLLLGMSCTENITITDLKKISSHGVLERAAERGAAKKLVGDLRIKTPSIDQTVRTFSGGNQQKVVIAKWLFRGSKVLVCDEPTRGIDVGARAEIYDLLWDLASEGRGILFISSDLPELIAICHRIIVFAKGRVVGEVKRGAFDQHRILSMAYEEFAT
ncbi:MAG TPA: sugar ABC transporter ATP-binding protein [Roseiarcus sp.]|jgi:ribose transport system ATP-binding protein|nr:sugar ABC transporter ATP-binding protein [Roseiarcus sp.]